MFVRYVSVYLHKPYIDVDIVCTLPVCDYLLFKHKIKLKTRKNKRKEVSLSVFLSERTTFFCVYAVNCFLSFVLVSLQN